MSLVINGSGSITGLAVGGLPDGTVDSGTLPTNSVDSAELIDGSIDTAHIAANQITSAIVPTGSSVQVVQTTSNTQTVIGTSFTACAPTVAITPSSSSNKILVRFNMGGMVNGTLNEVRLQIKRGSTVIKKSLRYGYNSNASSGWASCPITYEMLDSPSTTSATTYTLEAMKQTSGSFEINSAGGSDSGTAIATEIKG